jgi:c-di-GMP-binding flagellar brake protein YcgR
MNTVGKERRRFKRRVIVEDEVVGIFHFHGVKEELVTAKIMDLSEGGLQLALKRVDSKGIAVGKHLVLTKIKGLAELVSVADVELEIRWIVGPPSFDNIGVGCEIINISERAREQIRQFVYAE